MLLRILAPALVAIPLLAAGCGGSEDRTPVHPAGGTVLLDGKPFAKATVVFLPAKPQGRSPEDPAAAARVAETDDQGRFTLSTYEADDGAPAGEYVVTVQPAPPASVEDTDGRPPVAPRPSAALAKYGTAKTSPLKFTVKDGENKFAIDLK